MGIVVAYVSKKRVWYGVYMVGIATGEGIEAGMSTGGNSDYVLHVNRGGQERIEFVTKVLCVYVSG